ncbi:MAG TPA: hypothetical protein DEE98_02875 [Elusimicrobia bacterium]|nr:MAG: hypothetical protein A2278_07705 [Elusimicrobia bacterium RIFOXYA12_FULL_49_49]OGS07842.1 MAG: hypothetical protein A2204_06085 [Elusimicrobia bacterium RIFOXYA1_FULL_47_7]OGS09401.1 MAG: hypothetical protein A2386_07935 [Elusimicrobia bacterium RIFOXYB1_FULL_48_9]OGS16051.1 MAG: hypothetical protein A2251_02560 [Elusimicrobia bacterium RIFOXYA2_FULL_47_53]OGS25778.1 MAG: hypothetical protein A2339_05075 [Elusimicrobia bacterium RIFOXYB12_FULL_50_12]OGS30197.1 MAG: hypothetical protein
MRFFRLIAAVSVILTILVSPGAGSGKAGFEFLRIGLGARPLGMGEAFVGVADDIDSITWNPAGLVQINEAQQTFMHTLWLDGISIDYIAYAERLGPRSALGAGIEYLTSGDIDRRNKYGNLVGTYYAYDLMGAVSYAHKIGKNISLGTTLKYVSEKIEMESATGIAVDFGGLYKFSKMQIGLSVQNLGQEVRFRTSPFPMPLVLKAGISYKPISTLVLAVDVDSPIIEPISYRVGCEYQAFRVKNTRLFLRGGFKTNVISYLDSLAGLSLGTGLRCNEWQVDYALVPYGQFGETHRISLTRKFGGTTKNRNSFANTDNPVVDTIIPVDIHELPDARKAEEIYRDSLRWYKEKVIEYNLTREEEISLIKKLIAKFEPMGVDVGAFKKVLKAFENAK